MFSPSCLGPLLEMWAYEARRLFRDRLVGEKDLNQFEAILGSVLRSEWSTDASSLDSDGGAFYVTLGSPHTSVGDVIAASFGRPLGRLSATDLQEIVAKEIVAYGEFLSQWCCYSWHGTVLDKCDLSVQAVYPHALTASPPTFMAGKIKSYGCNCVDKIWVCRRLGKWY